MPLLGAHVLGCLVPYSVDVMEWNSAVTGGLKVPALLKKIETVMWRTSLSEMTNMAQVLDSAYTEYKQTELICTYIFHVYGGHFGSQLGFEYVVHHQG